jgi:hypothetical protein
MATDPPSTVLEHLIRERGMTYARLAAEFEAMARQQRSSATATPRHLARLARAERDETSTRTRRVLAAIFAVPADLILAPWTAEVAHVLAVPHQTPEEILAMTTERSRRFADSSASQHVAPEMIDQIADDVRLLATDYQHAGVGHLLSRVVDAQETIYALLDSNQPRPGQARDLYLFAGIVGGLLAKIAHDLKDTGSARTHARTAWMCAQQADHDGLRAWVKGQQALIAFWAGQPLESIRHAQEGAQAAARSGSTTAVWLSVSEARAHAALGDDGSTLDAIARAEDAWDHVSEDELDDLGGICTFARARQTYYAADALAVLGADHGASAERTALDALALYDDPSAADWSYSDQAGARADLAIARLHQRNAAGAAEALAPVLALPPGQRIHGIVASIQRVADAAHGDTSNTVLDLREQIEDFVARPAVFS